MADEARGYLTRQFATAWKLASFHLDGLTTAEAAVLSGKPSGSHQIEGIGIG